MNAAAEPPWMDLQRPTYRIHQAVNAYVNDIGSYVSVAPNNKIAISPGPSKIQIIPKCVEEWRKNAPLIVLKMEFLPRSKYHNGR